MALLDSNTPPSIDELTESSSDSVGVAPMYSDAAYGLDTHAAQAQESSVFSTIGNLATKAIPLTGLSVINSFANTAIDVTNWMGADNQRLSMENELGDGDTLDYYKAHSQGIETLGLIAGSFIPGTAALKALKLARLGAPTNILVRATNIFAGPKAALVEDALQTVNAGNKALFGSLNASKYQAIALGYGENFIQSLVFEAATAATMKASPILDGDSFKDTLDNMFFGALTGAGIGGTLEGAFTRGMFNKLLVSADITSKASELTTRLGKGNFLAGDKAYLLIDSMDKIPQGPGESVLSASKASRTIDSATLAFKKTVQDLVTGEGNEEVANAFSDIILKMRNEQGLNREEIYNQLARLKLVSRIDSDTSGVENSGRFYINRIANAEKDTADFSDILTPTPRYNLSTDAKEWLAPTDQAGIKASGYSQAFELKPGATRYNVSRSIDTFDPEGNLIPANRTASEAWASGYDIHVDAGNKKVYVNPKAPNIRQVAREGESRPLSIKEEQAYRTTGQLPKGARSLNGADVILDTKTGAIKNWASPVIGDLGEVKIKANGVSYGDNFSSQSIDAPITAQTSALDSNARYSWISNRGIAAGDSIHQSDTAVLEQLYREGASNKDGWLKYLQKKGIDRYADGTPIPTTLDGMLQDVKNSKDSLVADLLASSVPDAKPGMVRLYRGEMTGGKAAFPGSPVTGGWFTTDLSKAKMYGDVKYVDVAERDMNKFAQGHGGPDEFITDNEAIKGSTKPYVDGRKMSSEEISRRANVSEDYLANNLQSLEPKELMLDPEANNSVRHVKLSYDIGNIYQQDGQIQRGLMDVQYRVQIIQDAQQGTAAKYFGPEAGKFLATMKASDADISGSGAGFLSFAQGKYNSLSQQMERIGREVTAWYRKQEGKISDAFSTHTNALRDDPVLASEASNFIAARQRTGENYAFLPDALAQKYGMVSSSGNNTFAVLEKSLVRDKSGNILDWNKAYLPDNFVHGDLVASGLAKDLGQTGNSTYYQLSDKLAAFERANMQLNNANVVARNNLNAAWGLSKRLPQDILYTPPVNVSQAKHFAYVKLREGTGMGDDAVRVVTAKSKQDLETLIASIHEGDPDRFSVYTKEDLKQHHEVLGDYEYSRNFANTQVDAMLTRKGILNDIYPTTRGDQIAQNYVDWHLRQAMLLTRDHVELGNGQLFAELKAMGERFSSTEASQAGFVSAALGRSFDNPYAAYVKTALAIGAKDNYRIWSETQERLESFFNTAFNTAKRAFIDAKNGVLPYEEAATMAEKFGLGNPYGTAINSLKQAEQNYYGIANKLPDSRFLSKFVSTSNTILGATVIKLDTWQQIIHMLSTPILVASEANSVRQMLTTELPDGSGKMIPATSKVLFQSVRDFFGPKAEFEARLKLYQDNNFMHDADTVRDMRQLQDALTLPMGNFSQSKAMANLGKAEAFAQKFLTITNFSEQFTAWMAARSAHQMFEAAGYSGQQLLDQIGSFVNRAKGNMVASQRPVAFQGPLGQAIGLFQTYQFNLMQQLLRYVENGDRKTIAILGGMQGTLFGLQGLPGFTAINNHIVGNAATNPLHKDAYSAVPNLLDKKLGDYLLYGVASNITGAGLYTRGDINPRQVTLLPTNPMDFPAIAGGVRFLSALWDTAKRISDGGPIGANLLMGLEHNGLSRPLQGIAALAQGFSTTSKGDIASVIRAPNPLGDNTSGWSEMFSAATLSRLGGARPLEEAITMDANYRNTLYSAKDATRQERLGEAVRSRLLSGTAPTADEIGDFANQYAAAGGQIGHFGTTMTKWAQEATTSVANKVFNHLSTPRNQVAMVQMGGQPLPDYRNAGNIGVASASSASARQPVASLPGARQAPDGAHYIPDPSNPGKYLRLDAP